MVYVPTRERSAGGLAASLDRALGSRRERLTVMSRSSAESEEAVIGLVAQRNAPVLVVDGTEDRTDSPANEL